MDDATRELFGMPCEGAAPVTANEAVFLYSEKDGKEMIHRSSGYAGDPTGPVAFFRARCGKRIPKHSTMWTKDKPTCLECIAQGER